MTVGSRWTEGRQPSPGVPGSGGSGARGARPCTRGTSKESSWAIGHHRPHSLRWATCLHAPLQALPAILDDYQVGNEVLDVFSYDE